MKESMPVPLGINLNKDNIPVLRDTHCDSTFNASDRGFTSSITKLLEDFENFNIYNKNGHLENAESSLQGDNDNTTSDSSNEVAGLKAELEATRRKLAEYEGRSGRLPPASARSLQSARNNSPSPSPNGSLDLDEKDTLPFGPYEFQPLKSLPPPPLLPPPTPIDFPAPITPLRLPSASMPYHTINPGTVNPDTSFKEDSRSFSNPFPAPIGDSRRIPQLRSVSEDLKFHRDKEPWKQEPDWTTPWTGSSLTNPPRQLTGTASLGVVYNDQLPWPDTIVGPSPNIPRYSVLEPNDWRRLLDRSMSCNWNMVIEKVIYQSDQQASLFLQQKLKLATTAQKHEIVDAIVRHCNLLMVNRFGNFLVQRCFEYGTGDHIDGIANAMLGNVVNLSMDMFGCHVVQKAFDCVDEEHKAAMVKELLCRIPETVNHRFACHVWQKLLEIRWKGSPPVIMKYVNDALRGLWTEIALGETGSLVVQNIFENCLDEDKRPCVEEILENVDTIARGQWGNWVIQHIVEHGNPDDRLRALDIILQHSATYSMDQYASKVIEKALKCCGPDIFQSYISKIVEKEPGRPRVALIDISSDVYGNYLIQYVLQSGPQIVRDQICFHVRKHMVSLRGSRYGQRVAFQVERLRTAQKTTSNWPGRWE